MSNKTRKFRGAYGKPTLCESCHIECFKLCPWVYDEIRFEGLVTEQLIFEQWGEYSRMEKVVECSRYKREEHREII